VRAITAYLRGKKNRAPHLSGTTLDGQAVCLAPEADYLYQEQRLEGSIFNAVLMHPGFSPAATREDAFLYHTDATQPPDFANRVKEAMTLPFLPEWADTIWRATVNPKAYGLHADSAPVTRLESIGPLVGYQIRRDEGIWLNALRRLFKVKPQDVRKVSERRGP
jgi:hypothetical protein